MQVVKGRAVQGTILILDGAATNRIMLKVQLSSAYYHVVQTERLDGVLALAQRTRPDLIVTAMTLPDGNAAALKRILSGDAMLADVPVIALAPQNDRSARLRALDSGIDDVLSHPVDDLLLQARIRSLIRARSSAEELRLHDGHSASNVLGFGEPQAGFAPSAPVAQVALLTQNAATAALWRVRLQPVLHHRLSTHQMHDIHALMSDPVPDAVVVELTGAAKESGLRLLADLRARAATCHIAIIAVVGNGDAQLAADALDRGAHDVMPGGFCAEELGLRLTTQLQHKASADRLRDSVRDGLRAAVRDPMTGLYNRRYALPRLDAIARQAAQSGASFALLLADLDHFKRINDRHGHPAGDAVLTEAARRLESCLRAGDLIARMGGEEFLIALPDTDPITASRTAAELCEQINCRPFAAPGVDMPIAMTISIGAVICHPDGKGRDCGDDCTADLIEQADRALYVAKNAGRNRISLFQPAA